MIKAFAWLSLAAVRKELLAFLFDFVGSGLAYQTGCFSDRRIDQFDAVELLSRASRALHILLVRASFRLRSSVACRR